MKYYILHFPVLDSTNTYLKDNQSNLDDFTFAITDYQTKGKGRQGRTWLAKENDNLLFSLLLKNKGILSYGPILSLVAAVSICEVLENSYSLNNVKIKWPNDIYVNGKKICGILLEGELPHYIIIGMGINVNQKEFLGEYRINPTSLSLEINRNINLEEFKDNLCNKIYDNVSHIDTKRFIRYYKEHDYLDKKQVSFVYNNSHLQGVVEGVDEHFNILIYVEDKTLVISSGEISLIHC